jgi:trehalose-phosphatase
MLPSADELLSRLASRTASADHAQYTGFEHLRLFLDYDGTLAELAPTPDHVEPSQELVGLLGRLARDPRIQVTIISGRRLSHVQTLVPVPGILLAGTYGIELQTPEGARIDRLAYDAVRPTLTEIKPQWASLIASRKGFFLEDKGWSLALHARFADSQEAEAVLAEARSVATAAKRTRPASSGLFRLLGGHKFLEIGPRLAHKGRTVEYLLARWPWPGAQILYLGDDDKDEEAFDVIQTHGGLAIVVSREPRETQADFRLESPAHTRRWLGELLRQLG